MAERSVCFTHQDTLVFSFASPVAGPAAVLLGDADNDGNHELVVGGLDGALAVFKCGQEHPAYLATGLGGITAIGLGRFFLSSGDIDAAPRQLVAFTVEGRCHIFNIVPEATVSPGRSYGTATPSGGAAAAGLSASSVLSPPRAPSSPPAAIPPPTELHPLFTLSCPCNATSCAVRDAGRDGHAEVLLGTADGFVHLLALDFEELPNAPLLAGGDSGANALSGSNGGGGGRGGSGVSDGENAFSALMRASSLNSAESWHSTTTTTRLVPLQELYLSAPVVSVASLAVPPPPPLTTEAAPFTTNGRRRHQQEALLFVAAGLDAGSFEILRMQRPAATRFDDAAEPSTPPAAATSSDAAAAAEAAGRAAAAEAAAAAAVADESDRPLPDERATATVPMAYGGGLPLPPWGWAGGAQVAALPASWSVAAPVPKSATSSRSHGRTSRSEAVDSVGALEEKTRRSEGLDSEVVSGVTQFAVCTLDGRMACCSLRCAEGGAAATWQAQWCRQTDEALFCVAPFAYGGSGGGGSSSDTGGASSSGGSDAAFDAPAAAEELIAACSWSGRTYLSDRFGRQCAVFDPSAFLSHPVRAFVCGQLTTAAGLTEPCLCYVSGGADGLTRDGASGGEIVVYRNLWAQVGAIAAAPLPTLGPCLLREGIAAKLQELFEMALRLRSPEGGDARQEEGGSAREEALVRELAGLFGIAANQDDLGTTKDCFDVAMVVQRVEAAAVELEAWKVSKNGSLWPFPLLQAIVRRLMAAEPAAKRVT